MKTITLKIMIVSLICFGFSYAHEGHDHADVDVIEAPNGGVLKSLKNKEYVEVVSDKASVKIYFYDKNVKPESIEKFKVEADVELPKNKKKNKMVLRSKDTFFEFDFDQKGIHRFTLSLKIKSKESNADEKLTFNIEPKN